MNDNELFELCKSVYEATRWNPEDKYVLHGSELGVRDEIVDSIYNITEMGKEITFPLYTSDYLLERLPLEIRRGEGGPLGWLCVSKGSSFYVAKYRGKSDSDNTVGGFYWYGDTPIEALLKLTLELHEKGLLDARQ